jgi:hypothetical protein
MNTHVSNDDSSKARTELQSLDSNLQSRAGFEVLKMEQLERHLSDLKSSYSTWLSRLGLSQHDKALLEAREEKELEFARTFLTHQNQKLTIISHADVSFVAEVVKTLLRTGQAGLKGAAAALYREAMLNFQYRQSEASARFYADIERQYNEAAEMLPPIRHHILSQIDTSLRNWARACEKMQEEFISILEEN